VIWTVVSARRFIYWKFSILNIISTLTIQCCFIWFVGVSTTLRAVQLAFISSFGSLLVVIVNLFYGLEKGPRLATNKRKYGELELSRILR
jgi:hypothetical protein